jgi:carbon storage regulator CsrA
MTRALGIDRSDAFIRANVGVDMTRPTLSIKVGEKLIINKGQITVEFIEKRGNRARLYVYAPDLGISREELGHSVEFSGGTGLVLSRKISEAEGIYIGANIFIQVLRGGSNNIRIRTTAPFSVRVDREKIHKARLIELKQMPDADNDQPPS